MRPPETFETARLVARRPRIEDAPAVFAAYANDPEITRYLSWRAYTEVGPLATYLADRVHDWDMDASEYTWMLCMRGTDTPVGSIGVQLGKHGAVFGYVLGKKQWHQGLAVEALRYLVTWALTVPGVHRAWAFCDVENEASARVMEKAGMLREGVLRRWHVCPTIGSEPRDCIVCASVR